MDKITSDSVRSQLDYKIMMQYINDMLGKESPESVSLASTDRGATPGSIILGKKYADKYFSKINEMLSSEYVNIEILKSLSKEVLPDLEYIRADCKNRVYSKNVQDNDNMMSIILDFILTLNQE